MIPNLNKRKKTSKIKPHQNTKTNKNNQEISLFSSKIKGPSKSKNHNDNRKDQHNLMKIKHTKTKASWQKKKKIFPHKINNLRRK